MVLLAAPALACGSPGALGSSAPDGDQVVTFVSGSTGEAAAGAVVIFNGREYRTGPDGRVALADVAGDLDVGAPGFLRRQTRLRAGDTRLTLWPVGPAYPAEYVRTILYTSSDVGHSAVEGELPLERLAVSRAVVSLSSELAADPAALDAHRRAVAEINGATGGVVTFTLGGRSSGAAVFTTTIDPTLPWIGATIRDLRGATIVGGRIAFVSLDAARDARFICHELGHALGLQHSPDPSDLMYYLVQERSPSTFTANERLTVRLLLQRPPGNAFPDDDRGAGAGRASISVAVD